MAIDYAELSDKELEEKYASLKRRSATLHNEQMSIKILRTHEAS